MEQGQKVLPWAWGEKGNVSRPKGCLLAAGQAIRHQCSLLAGLPPSRIYLKPKPRGAASSPRRAGRVPTLPARSQPYAPDQCSPAACAIYLQACASQWWFKMTTKNRAEAQCRAHCSEAVKGLTEQGRVSAQWPSQESGSCWCGSVSVSQQVKKQTHT